MSGYLELKAQADELMLRAEEARQAELAQCRTWVMETTNVFATAARMIENSPQHCRKQRHTGNGECCFPRFCPLTFLKIKL